MSYKDVLVRYPRLLKRSPLSCRCPGSYPVTRSKFVATSSFMSVLLVAVLFSSCLKNTAEMQAVRVDAVVKTAQRFFMDSIAPAGYGRTGEGNPRLSTSKELLWDKATVVS